MKAGRAGGPLLVLAAAILWGTAGTAQETGPAAAWPPAVAALRSLAGGLLLVVVVLVWRGWATLRVAAARGRTPLVVAGLAIAVFQGAYFTGIRLTGVAVGTLLAIGSAPVWAGVLEALAGRRPGRRWALATLVTVTGTGLLVISGEPTDGTGIDAVGVLAALTAGAAYASYTVASSRLMARAVDGPAAMAWTFAISGVLLVPALALQPLHWATTPAGLVMLGWLAVATIALAYPLFAAGLRTVDAPTATTLTLAEPLTATLLAVLVVGERLPPAAVAGALLVALGLAAAGRPARGGRTVPAPTETTNDDR